MCTGSQQAASSPASPVTGAVLTDALRANLAVTIRTLAGKGTRCVDALLAGLTVVFISLTLVNVCIGRRRETRTRVSEMWSR